MDDIIAQYALFRKSIQFIMRMSRKVKSWLFCGFYVWLMFVYNLSQRNRNQSKKDIFFNVFTLFLSISSIKHVIVSIFVNYFKSSMKMLLILLILITISSSKSNCQLDCCRSMPDRPPMTYTFYQNTGRFIGGQGQSFIDTYGYSGHDEGYLNPEEQCNLNDIGPLPASIYKLSYCKNVMHQTTPRPCSFFLDPQIPEDMCGRGFAFFIHGCHCCSGQDDSEPPVLGCSEGCVVINYDNRRKLRLGDVLIVKHYEPKEQHLEKRMIVGTEQ